MFRTFIQFTVMFLTGIATFFWIRGSILLSTKDIAALAGTVLGYNSVTLTNLASQKADSLIAGLLLLASFLLQCWNVSKPSVVFGNDNKGIVVSIISSILVFIICIFGSSYLTKYYSSQAQILLQEKTK